MNKRLSQFAGKVNDIELHITVSKHPLDNKHFPEFKRLECDEGHLKKTAIYYNEIHGNFTKTLGRSFVNLLSFPKEMTINPSLLNILKISLSETQISKEEFIRKNEETCEFLKENKENNENLRKFAIEILRNALGKE